VAGKGEFEASILGPFEIMDRVGEVAYRLCLPPSSIIHPFSMSLNSRRDRDDIAVLLPPLCPGPEVKLKVEPVVILESRFVERKKKVYRTGSVVKLRCFRCFLGRVVVISE
jgi:hypothetical protein